MCHGQVALVLFPKEGVINLYHFIPIVPKGIHDSPMMVGGPYLVYHALTIKNPPLADNVPGKPMDFLIYFDLLDGFNNLV